MSVEGTGSALQLPGFKSQFQVGSCVVSSGEVLSHPDLFPCSVQLR